MNILFVVPRSFNPKQMYLEYPLGVGILGTILEKNGHNIQIYDGNVESPNILDLIEQCKIFKPDIVGFSVITPNYPVAKEQIKLLKEKLPEIKILAGGVHATLFPEDLLKDGSDIIVLGEGEVSLPMLITTMETGCNINDVCGIAYFNQDGIFKKNESCVNRVDINELPIINRNLFNLKKYTHHSMLASRGCPYKCNFCCNYTGTILKSGISINKYTNVINEMKYLQDELSANEIFFADDIFLIRKKDILAFCQEYRKEKLTVKWIGQMRVDTIDEEIAIEMSKSGCKRIYFGIESGSDEILKKSNKKTTKSKILEGIQCTKKAGIRVKTGWIYGLPGTIEQQYESINFMLKMKPHEISIHQLIPFPGTPYYKDPKRHGIIIKNKKDFESFCYGGLSGNIQFNYMSQDQLVKLLEDTASKLEQAGYVSSDIATKDDNLIYSTPLSKRSMNVFHKEKN